MFRSDIFLDLLEEFVLAVMEGDEDKIVMAREEISAFMEEVQ